MKRYPKEYKEKINKFLLENYTKTGLLKCSKILDIPEMTLIRWTRNLHLKVDKTIYVKNNVNLDLFNPIKEPFIAYFIGLIFADGNINRKYVEYTTTQEDWQHIKWIFEKIGKYSICYRHRDRYGVLSKPSVSIRFFSTRLARIFYDCDFKGNSLDRAMQNIPKNLWNYFLRAYSDGDGCWFFSDKTSCFSISAPYDFNFSFLCEILKANKIKFSIRRYITKNGYKSSYLSITGMQNLEAIGKIIYFNYPNDKIGFPRKYEKFIKIIDKNLKGYYDKLHDSIKKYPKGFTIQLKQENMSFRISGLQSMEEALKTKEDYIRKNFSNKASEFCYSERIVNCIDIKNGNFPNPLD